MPYKILIVDDEADIRELLSYNLGKQGFEVLTAKNGKEAIEKAVTECPDLLLLDLMMPVMDGWEAFQQLKQMPFFPSLKIVFLSAVSNPSKEQEAIAEGAKGFIPKSVRMAQLCQQISAFLQAA